MVQHPDRVPIMTRDDKKEFRRITSDVRDKMRRLVYLAMDLEEYELSAMLVTIINVTEQIDTKLDTTKETEL